MDDKRTRQMRDRILLDPVVEGFRSAMPETPSPPVYLVGGALRDRWLGAETRDFDFVVHGEALSFADGIAAALGARFVLLDEDWGVARLVWARSGEHEAPALLDFAPMRGETIQEDLWQRDFTCNAMAMRISRAVDEEAVPFEDPTGGTRDLRARLIRMVHPARLREDPLRLIRAFRLAHSLDFQIERHTFEAVRGTRQGLRTVAGERIREELFKILASPHSLESILQMDEAGLLTTLFPEMDGLKGLRQGRFHHLDAWKHTLEAYRKFEEGWRKGLEPLGPWEASVRCWAEEAQGDVLPLLKLALLFHDAGKPETRTVDDRGEPHFYGHAAEGARIAAEAMRRLRTSRSAEERVRKWVRYHMGPVQMMRAMETDRLSERAKIRFLRRLGNDTPGMLLLSLADFLATGGPAASGPRQESFRGLLASLLDLYFRRDAASIRGTSLVTGKDLIEALGIAPGPAVGRLLRRLEEARVEGTVRNRDEAIALARSLLHEHEPQSPSGR